MDEQQFDDWRQEYVARGKYTVHLLVKAHSENNPEAGAHVVSQMCQDETLVMAVVGQLLSNWKLAEDRRQAGAPVVAHDPTVPSPIWMTSLADQMAGAAENGDSEGYARMGVDGHLRAFREDEVDTFGGIVDVLLGIDQNNLILLCAQAMHRLTGKASP